MNVPLEHISVFSDPLTDVTFYIYYRVKSVMGHLDGRQNFPRLSIGMVLVWVGFKARLSFVSLNLLCFCQALVNHLETWI